MLPLSDRAPPRLRVWVALPVGVAVLAALLVYAGPQALARSFAQASPTYLLLAVGAYVLFFIARGLRWSLLLRSAGGPPGGFAMPVALGSVAWMVSAFIPFKAGDAVRAVVMARRRAMPLPAVVGTVGVERALDLACLALAASIGLAVLAASDVALPGRVAPLIALAWLIPVAGVALAFGLAVALRRRPRSSRALRILGQLLDGVLAIARTPRLAGKAIAWTLAIKACQIVVCVCLLKAFLPETPLLAAAVVPLFLLSFLVAFIPGHVGTYEAAFVLIFSLVGLPTAALAAVAVAAHVTAIVIVSTLGGLSLIFVGARLRTPRRSQASAPMHGGLLASPRPDDESTA